MANITGEAWRNLTNGHIISAAFHLYDTAFLHWTIGILFLVYQFMLLIKTRNLTLSWVTGLIFASLYIGSYFVKAISAQIIFVILALELAAVLYFLIWK